MLGRDFIGYQVVFFGYRKIKEYLVATVMPMLTELLLLLTCVLSMYI